MMIQIPPATILGQNLQTMSETALRRLGRSVGRLAAATIAAAAGVAMAPAPEGSAEAVWFPVLHESFTIDSPLGS